MTRRALSLFVFLFFACAAAAIAKPNMDFIQGAEKRVSIDLRDSDVVDVLKFLSQKGKFNIYISPEIQGRATLKLEDVRIGDILNIILLSNKLAFAQEDTIVYVMTQEAYKARYGQDYNDAREVELFRLKHTAPAQIFKMLEPTKSSVGTIIADEKTGTLILMDTPQKMAFMMDVVEQMDQPLESRVFDLSYAKAIAVQSLITAQADGLTTVLADERSNQIIVTALPNRMKEIEKLVTSVDRKTREVAIDSQIVKIVLSDDYDRGVDWRYMFQKGLLEPLDLNVSLPSSPTVFGSIEYSTFGSDGFEAIFKFLQTIGESKILASPRLTVIEGEEAKILIGTREAYVTSTTTTGSETTSVSESVSFVDVGISLKVSAQINKEGYVTMKIQPEVSSVVRTLTTPSDNEIPIVDTTQAETRVMVKDGTTIVIGGLRKDEKTATQDQIPILGDLPFVGKAFQRVGKELEQTELVVFLTPHVIEGDKNMLREEIWNIDAKGAQAYPGKGAPAAAPKPAQDPATGGVMGSAGPGFKGIQAYSEKG